MKVHRGFDTPLDINNPIVTSGTFDGIHEGHLKILSRLKFLANENNGESVVITFWPHPRFVLNTQNKPIGLINTLDEKILLLEKHGIDHLVIIPFTKEFSALTSIEFIDKILIDKIKTSKLVIGYDHKFGKNREGSFSFLMENQALLGFTVEEIPKHELENISISSTKIREAIQNGNIELVNQLLGYNYSLTGKVVLGKQIGRTIKVPTANLEINDHEKLLPKDGVFVIRSTIQKQEYFGVLNIGTRPTVNGEYRSIEAHFLDFDLDIYNKQITIEIIKYIRPEIKFNDLNELKDQITKDIEVAKSHINASHTI